MTAPRTSWRDVLSLLAFAAMFAAFLLLAVLA